MKKINLFVILFLIGSLSFAQKTSIEVEGILTENATWSTDTVKITDETTINPSVAITISPGTVVEFQGNFPIIVNGILQAKGTETDSIKFTPVNQATGWGGIIIKDNIETDSIILDYCIFEYGNAEKGVINVKNFSLFKLSNSLIQNNFINSSYYNGGLFVNNSNILILNNTFSQNEGAIWLDGNDGIQDTCYVIGNTIINNQDCGIMLMSGMFAFIENNYIAFNNNDGDNTWDNAGGGIYLDDWGNADIRNNTIYENTAKWGAGIYLYTQENTKIINNKIYNNNGGIYGRGGAIYFFMSKAFDPGEEIIVAGNDIANNYAGYTGGAIHFESTCTGTIWLFNNNIVNNKADLSGGGIHFAGSSPYLYNNIIYGNRLGDGTNIGNQISLEDFNGAGDIYADPDFYNCVIEGGLEDIDMSQITSYEGDFENIITENPIFTQPTENAGDEYDANQANFTLQEASPCIEAGTGQDLFNQEYDIDGNIRLIGCQIDIGAYEFTQPPNEFDVVFTVTDGENPIENAEIIINTETFYTNENGEATATLPEGTYNCSVTALNFNDFLENVTVECGGNTINIILIPNNVTINETNKNNFIIYPNPSNGTFTISNLSAFSKPESVEITDITGKIILISQFSTLNSQFSIKEKGIYFVNITTEKGIYTKKLIIQ